MAYTQGSLIVLEVVLFVRLYGSCSEIHIYFSHFVKIQVNESSKKRLIFSRNIVTIYMYISYSRFFFIFRQQMTTVREKKNKDMLHIIQWRALLLVRARFINSLVIKRKRISKQTTKV